MTAPSYCDLVHLPQYMRSAQVDENHLGNIMKKISEQRSICSLRD